VTYKGCIEAHTLCLMSEKLGLSQTPGTCFMAMYYEGLTMA